MNVWWNPKGYHHKQEFHWLVIKGICYIKLIIQNVFTINKNWRYLRNLYHFEESDLLFFQGGFVLLEHLMNSLLKYFLQTYGIIIFISLPKKYKLIYNFIMFPNSISDNRKIHFELFNSPVYVYPVYCMPRLIKIKKTLSYLNIPHV